jgi:hypothetical protein
MPRQPSASPPAWRIPVDLRAILDAEEQWEDPRWDPLTLTVIAGTAYRGRPIPMSWEVTFSPADDFFDELNAVLEAAGIDADGYGWLHVIESYLAQSTPDLLKVLYSDDTEQATCVIWVETEADCRNLIETIWTIMHDPRGPLLANHPSG